LGLEIGCREGDSDFNAIAHAKQQIGNELDSRLVDMGDIKVHVVLMMKYGDRPNWVAKKCE